MEDEINRVYCTVCLSPFKNNFVFNQQKLNEELTAHTVKRLKHYGVNAIPQERTGLGGGGWPVFWELVRQLWENKELLLIPVTIVRGFKNSYWNRQNKKRREEKATIDISLSIRIKNKYENDNFYYSNLGSALTNLKHLASDVNVYLSAMYPLFECNERVYISSEQRSWKAGVSMVSQQLTSHNNLRIAKHLLRLKVVDNTDVSVAVTRLGLIVELEQAAVCDKGGWAITPKGPRTKKRYYFT